MSKYTYEILIKGYGTRDEIISELKEIIKGMENQPVTVLDGADWEGENFNTKIHECIRTVN